MTIVKICGLTNLDDALHAADVGADMLGFILYARSQRYVTPAKVHDIVRQVKAHAPHIVTVGVFVNELPEVIGAILDSSGLDLAQLSGDELPNAVSQLAGRAYKAVRSAENAETFLKHTSGLPPRPSMPDLLLDADHPTLYGGSGVRADALLASQMARQCRLLLAGGLTPENVAQAVRLVQPWGVDVASGVEAAPGKKDHAKVRAFIQMAQN